jgi:hypothetical protein
MLTSGQQHALVQWRKLLAKARLDRVLIRRDPGSGPPQKAERFQVLARLFGEGQDVEGRELKACVPDELLSTVEALGLVNRVGDRVRTAYRLVFHLGLWLFSERVLPSAKFYLGK